MITSAVWLNPTRIIGLLAYGAAVTCCCLAWIRSNDKRGKQLAARLTLFECLMLLDIAFNLRWKLHDLFASMAARHHEYASRRLPQTIVVCLLGGILLLGLFATWRRWRGREGALLAVSGAVLSLIFWCLEVVSLHAVDHVLYSQLGGIMAVTLPWVLACAMTSIGVLLESRSYLLK